jgi:hypothetical protein
MTHRGREGTYRYARISQAEDWLRLGWVVVADLGPAHGQWSVLAYWPCDCKARVPA